MKRKALLKTIIDILMIIGAFCFTILLLCITGYLFINLPYWILKCLGLSKVLETYSTDMIYGAEVMIVTVFVLIVVGIRHLYLENLEELAFKENNLTQPKSNLEECEALENGCNGCIHQTGCGFNRFQKEDSYLTEEERFELHCVGCCCGDGCECNKGQRCSNYEDGTEPFQG